MSDTHADLVETARRLRSRSSARAAGRYRKRPVTWLHCRAIAPKVLQMILLVAIRGMHAAMTWREFWDRERTTYINERHRQLESELIGRAIETFIPHGTASILDYGCSDNRVADECALHCRNLILC